MALVEEPYLVRADCIPVGRYVRFEREGQASWERLFAAPRYNGLVFLWTKDDAGDIHRTQVRSTDYMRVAREELR